MAPNDNTTTTPSKSKISLPPGLLRKLSRSINLLFWVLLLLLLVGEGLVIKTSAGIVLKSRETSQIVQPGKGVRINFKDYDEAVNRIQNARNFAPSLEAGADPFAGTRVKAVSVPVYSPASTTPSSTPARR